MATGSCWVEQNFHFWVNYLFNFGSAKLSEFKSHGDTDEVTETVDILSYLKLSLMVKV